MSETASNEDEKRNFFRVEGFVYLRLDKPGEIEKAETEPETLDRVGIHLLHLKNLIKYDPPAHDFYFRNLIHIMEQMHSQLTNKVKPQVFTRTHATISGSGIEFIWNKAYEKGEDLTLTLSFMDYPFQTVSVPAQVQDCAKVKGDAKTSRLVLSYADIPEADRELIIKFVNSLQRLELSKHRGQTAEKPD